MTHWDTWKEIISEHPSYLSSIIVGSLLKKMDVAANSGDDWRKKKKRKQTETTQVVIKSAVVLYQELSETYNKNEKDAYEQSFNIVRTETKAKDPPKVKAISANSILDDLAKLKKRAAEKTPGITKESEQPKVVIWQQAKDWTPKPFGVL